MKLIKNRFSLSLAILLLLLSALQLSSCSWSHFNIRNLFKKKKSQVTAADLMQKGLDKFYKHKYDDAIQAFEQVKERYPFSKFATMAELRVADCYYYEKQYPEAATAYEDFSRLHPSHSEIPRVLYQIGMCHYRQHLGDDRDQTQTIEALRAFERVLKRYSKSEYGKKAAVRVAKCKYLLARHEYYVANFYYRTGKYRASMLRLETLKNNYSDVKDTELQRNFRKLYSECTSKLNEEYSKNPSKKKIHRFSNLWNKVYFWGKKEDKNKGNTEIHQNIQENQNNQQLGKKPKQKEKKSFWHKLLFWKHRKDEEQ